MSHSINDRVINGIQFSVIPISGMLETAAASVFWMVSMAQSAATTGRKKKKKEKKILSFQMYFPIPSNSGFMLSTSPPVEIKIKALFCDHYLLDSSIIGPKFILSESGRKLIEK